MKTEGIVKRLIIILYRTYRDSETNRKYGIYPLSLTNNSGIRFGNAQDALAAIEKTRDKGWIKILNDPQAKQVETWHKIQLTEDGIIHADELLRPAMFKYLRRIYVATVGSITKGLKKH